MTIPPSPSVPSAGQSDESHCHVLSLLPPQPQTRACRLGPCAWGGKGGSSVARADEAVGERVKKGKVGRCESMQECQDAVKGAHMPEVLRRKVGQERRESKHDQIVWKILQARNTMQQKERGRGGEGGEGKGILAASHHQASGRQHDGATPMATCVSHSSVTARTARSRSWRIVSPLSSSASMTPSSVNAWSRTATTQSGKIRFS